MKKAILRPIRLTGKLTELADRLDQAERENAPENSGIRNRINRDLAALVPMVGGLYQLPQWMSWCRRVPGGVAGTAIEGFNAFDSLTSVVTALGRSQGAWNNGTRAKLLGLVPWFKSIEAETASANEVEINVLAMTQDHEAVLCYMDTIAGQCRTTSAFVDADASPIHNRETAGKLLKDLARWGFLSHKSNRWGYCILPRGRDEVREIKSRHKCSH